MDRSEAEDLLQRYWFVPVKVKPYGSISSQPHRGRARLLGVTAKGHAIIKPFDGHETEEKVPLSHVSVWKSQLATIAPAKDFTPQNCAGSYNNSKETKPCKRRP